MIVLHAEFPIDPEHHEEARQATKDLVAATNEGAIEYSVLTDIQDEPVSLTSRCSAASRCCTSLEAAD